MKTMETLVGEGQKVQETLNEKVKEAQEMRKEIDQVRNMLDGIPGDLDSEILRIIEQQVKRQANSDISGVEFAANEDRKTGGNIKSEF